MPREKRKVSPTVKRRAPLTNKQKLDQAREKLTALGYELAEKADSSEDVSLAENIKKTMSEINGLIIRLNNQRHPPRSKEIEQTLNRANLYIKSTQTRLTNKNNLEIINQTTKNAQKNVTAFNEKKQKLAEQKKKATTKLEKDPEIELNNLGITIEENKEDYLNTLQTDNINNNNANTTQEYSQESNPNTLSESELAELEELEFEELKKQIEEDETDEDEIIDQLNNINLNHQTPEELDEEEKQYDEELQALMEEDENILETPVPVQIDNLTNPDIDSNNNNNNNQSDSVVQTENIVIEQKPDSIETENLDQVLNHLEKIKQLNQKILANDTSSLNLNLLEKSKIELGEIRKTYYEGLYKDLESLQKAILTIKGNYNAYTSEGRINSNIKHRNPIARLDGYLNRTTEQLDKVQNAQKNAQSLSIEDIDETYELTREVATFLAATKRGITALILMSDKTKEFLEYLDSKKQKIDNDFNNFADALTKRNIDKNKAVLEDLALLQKETQKFFDDTIALYSNLTSRDYDDLDKIADERKKLYNEKESEFENLKKSVDARPQSLIDLDERYQEFNSEVIKHAKIVHQIENDTNDNALNDIKTIHGILNDVDNKIKKFSKVGLNTNIEYFVNQTSEKFEEAIKLYQKLPNIDSKPRELAELQEKNKKLTEKTKELIASSDTFSDKLTSIAKDLQVYAEEHQKRETKLENNYQDYDRNKMHKIFNRHSDIYAAYDIYEKTLAAYEQRIDLTKKIQIFIDSAQNIQQQIQDRKNENNLDALKTIQKLVEDAYGLKQEAIDDKTTPDRLKEIGDDEIDKMETTLTNLKIDPRPQSLIELKARFETFTKNLIEYSKNPALYLIKNDTNEKIDKFFQEVMRELEQINNKIVSLEKTKLTDNINDIEKQIKKTQDLLNEAETSFKNFPEIDYKPRDVDELIEEIKIFQKKIQETIPTLTDMKEEMKVGFRKLLNEKIDSSTAFTNELLNIAPTLKDKKDNNDLNETTLREVMQRLMQIRETINLYNKEALSYPDRIRVAKALKEFTTNVKQFKDKLDGRNTTNLNKETLKTLDVLLDVSNIEPKILNMQANLQEINRAISQKEDALSKLQYDPRPQSLIDLRSKITDLAKLISGTLESPALNLIKNATNEKILNWIKKTDVNVNQIYNTMEPLERIQSQPLTMIKQEDVSNVENTANILNQRLQDVFSNLPNDDIDWIPDDLKALDQKNNDLLNQATQLETDIKALGLETSKENKLLTLVSPVKIKINNTTQEISRLSQAYSTKNEDPDFIKKNNAKINELKPETAETEKDLIALSNQLQLIISNANALKSIQQNIAAFNNELQNQITDMSTKMSKTTALKDRIPNNTFNREFLNGLNAIKTDTDQLYNFANGIDVTSTDDFTDKLQNVSESLLQLNEKLTNLRKRPQPQPSETLKEIANKRQWQDLTSEDKWRIKNLSESYPLAIEYLDKNCDSTKSQQSSASLHDMQGKCERMYQNLNAYKTYLESYANGTAPNSFTPDRKVEKEQKELEKTFKEAVSKGHIITRPRTSNGNIIGYDITGGTLIDNLKKLETLLTDDDSLSPYAKLTGSIVNYSHRHVIVELGNDAAVNQTNIEAQLRALGITNPIALDSTISLHITDTSAIEPLINKASVSAMYYPDAFDPTNPQPTRYSYMGIVEMVQGDKLVAQFIPGKQQDATRTKTEPGTSIPNDRVLDTVIRQIENMRAKSMEAHPTITISAGLRKQLGQDFVEAALLYEAYNNKYGDRGFSIIVEKDPKEKKDSFLSTVVDTIRHERNKEIKIGNNHIEALRDRLIKDPNKVFGPIGEKAKLLKDTFTYKEDATREKSILDRLDHTRPKETTLKRIEEHTGQVPRMKG